MKVSMTRAKDTYSNGKRVKLDSTYMYINVSDFKNARQQTRIFKKIKKLVEEEND